MIVKIQAMGILKDYLGQLPTNLELPENSSVNDLLLWTRKHPMVHPDLPISIIVSNQYAKLDAALIEHQLYFIIPPVSGG
jgi:hypothetical protein